MSVLKIKNANNEWESVPVINGEDAVSPTITTSKVGRETTLTITDVNGTHTATILDGVDGTGSGDMTKSVYDTNNNGIVDNAETVNNHTVQSDVPANAVFTDTTYTAGTGIAINNGVISNTQTSAEWGNITGTLSNQTDLQTALNNKADANDMPTKVSDLTNDSGFITSSSLPTKTSDLTNDSGFITNNASDLINYTLTSDLSNVAITGSYEDLTNKPTIPTETSDLTNDSGFITDSYHDNTKQDTLVSGTNIKTINNESILGSGNITVSGGSSTDVQINGTSITSNNIADIITESSYNASTNKIATMSDIPNVPTATSDLTNDSGFITSTVNNLANYTTTSDLNTSLNNIEDGIEDIDDRVTDNEQDIIQINNMLDMFNDTSGSDWKAMMKNKIDYCINNINTTKNTVQAFINGGWSGVNYGFGLFSKIWNFYQLVWFSKDYSYYCRKNTNGTYEYSCLNNYTKTTDANGWTVLQHNGYTEYYKKGTMNVSFSSGPGWANLNATALPTGMTRNTANIYFSGGTSKNDAALTTVIGISDANDNVVVANYWHYGSSVNRKITWWAKITKID